MTSISGTLTVGSLRQTFPLAVVLRAAVGLSLEVGAVSVAFGTVRAVLGRVVSAA